MPFHDHGLVLSEEADSVWICGACMVCLRRVHRIGYRSPRGWISGTGGQAWFGNCARVSWGMVLRDWDCRRGRVLAVSSLGRLLNWIMQRP